MNSQNQQYRIALYCRTASRTFENPKSCIFGQLEHLGPAILLGNSLGINGQLVEIYREYASGLDKARPLFTKLKREIELGNINLLLVRDLSRISRNASDLAEFLEFTNGRCRVISLTEGFDSEPSAKSHTCNLSSIMRQGLVGGQHV